MKTTQKTTSLAALLSASILLAASPLAFAASNTWSGAGGNTTWSNAANWGSAPSSTDSAIIGTGGSAANLNGAQTVNDLTINRAATFQISDSTNSSSGLTLTTGNLTFGGAGVFTYTISSNVTLGANGTWTGNSANGTLTVSGRIKEANAGTKLNIVAGSGGVTLLGSNSFSGGLEISGDASNVTYGNTGAIGTGNLTLSHSGAGTLQNTFGVDNGGTALAIYNNSVNLNNNTSGIVTLVANGTNDRGWQINEITGTAGTSTIYMTARGKTVRIANGVSATGFNGNGLQLYANNAAPGTFEFGGSTGSTFLNVLGASGNQSANILFSAAVSQNGTVSLANTAGTAVNTFGITHVGGNSTFSGTSDITNASGSGFVNYVARDSGSRMILAGTITDGANTVGVRVNNSYTDNINGTNSPTGTVEFSKSTGNTYDGPTTVYAGTLIVSNSSGSATGTGNVTVQGAATLGGNGIISGNVSYTSSSNSTFAGTFNGSGKTLTMNGTGATLTLSGNNSYTGATTVNAGVLTASHSNALGSTAGNTTVSSGAALQLSGGISIGAEALSLNGTGISSTGALRNISSNNAYGGTISLAGATTIGSDAGTLTLSNGSSITGTNTNLTIVGAGSITINGTIATGTGTLTKNGSGTLALNGNNSLSGGLEIQGDASLVYYQNTGAIGTGNLTLSHNGAGTQQNVFGVDNGGTALAIYNNSVNLNNNTSGAVWLAANTLNDRGFQINEITGTAGSSDYLIFTRGKTARIANGVSATGFNGNGLQLYANNANPNTYEFGGSTGGTYLNVGGGGTGNQTANVLFTAPVSQNGTVSLGKAALTAVNTFGITHVGGNSTFSGTFDISGASGAGAANLVAKDSGSRMIISGAVTDGTSTAGLQINNTYNVNISGNGTNLVANNPTGTVELSKSTGNTYDGGTTVSSGTLLVSNSSGSGTGTGNVTVSAGAKLGGTGIIAPTGSNGVTLNNTAILAPGNGTTGTLVLNSAGTTGAMLTMNSGAKFSTELGASLASDKVNFWTYAGASDFVLNSNVIDITMLSGAGAGTYNLFNFYSNSGTTFTAAGFNSGLSLNFLDPASWSGTLDYSTLGQINLVVTAVPEPSTCWALLAVSPIMVMMLLRRRRTRL